MQPEAAAPLEDEPAAVEAAGTAEEQQCAGALLPTPFDLPASAEKPDAAEQQVAAEAEPAAFEPPAAEPAAAEPAAEPASGMQCEPVGGLFEPTITLSTRDAFAAINQMFGVSGCASMVLCVWQATLPALWCQTLYLLMATLPRLPSGLPAGGRRPRRPARWWQWAGRSSCCHGAHHDHRHQGRLCCAQSDVQGAGRSAICMAVSGAAAGGISSEQCMQDSTPSSRNASCLPFCRARCRWNTAACRPTPMPSPR